MRPHAAVVLLVPLAACQGKGAGNDSSPGMRVPAASAATLPASVTPPAAAACPTRPACDAPPPPAVAPRSFKHKRSALVSAAGDPRHRGRDLFLVPGGPQWVIGKFAYGAQDKDIEDEEIDVHLLRDCSGQWEKVGTFRTTEEEGSHPEVLGVEDKGGQIFLDLAKASLPRGPLGIGRHRIHMVVAGDGTSTDLIVEVLAPGARIAVTDVDGTLTESEGAIVGDVVQDEHAEAHAGAADAMKALAGRGYFLFYLTARPDWLVARTRRWLALRGFPPGILHTTVTSTGVFGDAAAAFKSRELTLLKDSTGLVPEIAFGNMPSDVATYAAAGVPPARAYFYRLDGDARGGVKHADYRALVPALAGLSARCP